MSYDVRQMGGQKGLKNEICSVQFATFDYVGTQHLLKQYLPGKV